MNGRTTLISSALLLAVLGWACESDSPTSPSALGTPAGGSLNTAGGDSREAAGGVSRGAAGRVISGVKGGGKGCVEGDTRPKCNEDPPPPPPTFLVTIAGDIVTQSPQNAFGLDGGGVRALTPTSFAQDFGMVFDDATGCDLADETGGGFNLIRGDAGGPHVHVTFNFTPVASPDILHTLTTEGVPASENTLDDWDPAVVRTVTVVNRDWEITAKGKGHQSACKGTGGGLDFLITIDPV